MKNYSLEEARKIVAAGIVLYNINLDSEFEKVQISEKEIADYKKEISKLDLETNKPLIGIFEKIYLPAIAANKEKEQLYCYCQQPNDGSEMILCDGDSCKNEWFHFKCVGIALAPKGDWFCHNCQPKRQN